VIRRISVQSQPGQIVRKTNLQNTHHKKGLVEWLKVSEFKPKNLKKRKEKKKKKKLY
jgi:hypothetical protein